MEIEVDIEKRLVTEIKITTDELIAMSSVAGKLRNTILEKPSSTFEGVDKQMRIFNNNMILKWMRSLDDDGNVLVNLNDIKMMGEE